ncbi:putative quinol monooxygenase [Alcanivorax hongdengensis]|nr:putative quinol monooxygenase [Alcanivorax hongdengensis]
MIIVKGSFPVKENDQPRALDLVQALARAARKDRGCLAYEVYLQADEPRVIMVWQQWTSLDALETHFASSHVDSFLDAIPDMLDGDVTSTHFDVTHQDGEPLAEDMDGHDIAPLVLADNITLH